MGKCTLADVAKACGVATYTVSRAINDKKDISKETKERILKVAKEMGYTTNVTAKNLRVGNSNTIAIVYDDFENPYYNSLIKKISYKLNEEGYSIALFYDFDSISLLNTKLLKRVVSSNVIGIISFMKVTANAKKFNNIVNIPIIQLGIEDDDNDIDCVYYDDVEGSYKLTNLLLNKGYKNIGFINATMKLKSGMNRIKGYKKALLKRNIENLNVIHLTESNLTVEEATQKLVDMNVDSIICYSDMTCLMVIKYLKTIGRKEIKIVGFDNINQFFPLPIELISAYGNMDDFVNAGISMLLNRINESSLAYKKVVLPMSINKNCEE